MSFDARISVPGKLVTVKNIFGFLDKLNKFLLRIANSVIKSENFYVRFIPFLLNLFNDFVLELLECLL